MDAKELPCSFRGPKLRSAPTSLSHHRYLCGRSPANLTTYISGTVQIGFFVDAVLFDPWQTTNKHSNSPFGH